MRLAAAADIVLEGEPPDALAALGLDHTDLRAGHDKLIWVSVTPFGRTGTRAHEPATDLTLLAGGGPVWSCGYDDHSLPPVRGGGNQAFHIGSTFAVMGALTAVLARGVTGRGQHIDVSMHAACNVTTEMGSYGWLVARETVVRQTGRHAMTTITMPTQMLCADGRYVTTGFPPRAQRDFESLIDWLDSLGLREEFPDIVLLDLAVERGGVSIAEMATDPVAVEIFGAGREALMYIAERTTADEFFRSGQIAGSRVRRGRRARGGVRVGALRRTRLPGRGRARRPRARVPLPGRAVPHAGVAVAHLEPRAEDRRARRRGPRHLIRLEMTPAGPRPEATLVRMDQQNLTVFRSRLRDDAPADYGTLADDLEARARTFPGFVEFKMFLAADGERLALVTFATADAEAAWRDDEQHRAAQQRGREEFYAEYDVAVCAVQRRQRWERSGS